MTAPVEKLPEEQRQALLRFAAFEAEKMSKKDDVTLTMMHVAFYKLFERDPKRGARILASALAIYGGAVPGAEQS